MVVLQKKKRDRAQINKIRNEKGETTSESFAEIQRIIRDYYKQLYANEIDSLEEMNKFLERYNFQRLNQEELEKINRPITNNEIKTIIKTLPTNKSLGPNSFTGKFYQTFRENLTPILLKVFEKTTEREKLPNSFHKAVITTTLITKADKHITKKENYRPIMLTNIDAKIPNIILVSRIPQHIKSVVYQDQVGFIQGM